MVFGEDDRRIRAGHAGANLATVRRAAISMPKRDDATIRTPRKAFRTARDTTRPEVILCGNAAVFDALVLTPSSSRRGVFATHIAVEIPLREFGHWNGFRRDDSRLNTPSPFSLGVGRGVGS